MQTARNSFPRGFYFRTQEKKRIHNSMNKQKILHHRKNDLLLFDSKTIKAARAIWQWSNDLCSKLGVDQEKLPGIVVPWQVVGEVSKTTASDFGLAPGTVIAAGCGDTAANALGGGIVRAGMVFDVAGTAAVLAGCTDTFVA